MPILGHVNCSQSKRNPQSSQENTPSHASRDYLCDLEGRVVGLGLTQRLQLFVLIEHLHLFAQGYGIRADQLLRLIDIRLFGQSLNKLLKL